MNNLMHLKMTMINTEVYQTKLINELQKKIDSLISIGEFSSKIKFFLEENYLLDYSVRGGFTVLNNGETIFFLKTNENNNNNSIIKSLKYIFKKHQKKDFFCIDWLIYNNNNPYKNISEIIVDWYKEEKYIRNGFNGINL